MREITFRGKQLDDGEWAYGYYIYNEHMGVIKHIIATNYAQIYVNSFYVDGKTVGQYTGLKDMNGKKVYEGDLIQISIFNHWSKSMIAQKTVSVEFKDYKYGVQWADSDFTGLDGFTNTTFEVVGNIYEQIKEPTA